jgi:hypothetical protein
MNIQEDCPGKDIETVDCEGGECQIGDVGVGAQPSDYSDRIVYFSLIIVCTLCVIFAVLFAHSKSRKRRVPSFITTDDGKLTVIFVFMILHGFIQLIFFNSLLSSYFIF